MKLKYINTGEVIEMTTAEYEYCKNSPSWEEINSEANEEPPVVPKEGENEEPPVDEEEETKKPTKK
jgi:hypothetical protein